MIKSIRIAIVKFYKGLKLKQKLRGIYLILAVAYLVIIAVSIYELISNSITQHLRVNSRTSVEGIIENLNGSFQSINNLSLLIMNDDDVLLYLREGNPIHSSNAVSNMKRISAAFPNVYSIFLIRDNNQYISTGRDITEVNVEQLMENSWRDPLIERRGGSLIRLEGAGIFAMNTGADIISFMRQVYDRDTQLAIGFMVVNMPTSIFNEAIARFLDNPDTFRVLDVALRGIEGIYVEEEFIQLMQFEDSYIQRVDQHATGMNVITSVMDNTSSIRVGISEEISYFSLLRAQVNILWIGFFLITIIGLFVIGAFITKTITTPIERLRNSMDEVKQGRLKRVTMKLPNDEIGELKETYNNMLIETNKLIDDLVEQEKNMKNLELEILYEQVKPHFLYNTLDTICYLVFEKSQMEVYDAVQTLSHFYRKSLSKGKTVISLEDELAIVKDYLTLQKLRYGDVISDRYEVYSNISNVFVPKLVLQPLVENCIYHGIRPKGEAGEILIRIGEKEDHIEITIRDDGVGLEAEQIQRLLNEDTGSSFGFKGTIERLRLYYQKEDIVEVDSKKGEYFELRITIPLQSYVT